MNIGFDFDKIFIDYPPFIPSGIIDRLYRQKSNGVLFYRIPSKLEKFLRLLTHFSAFRPPIIINIKFIKKLAKKNTSRHYLISSRFSFLKNKTKSVIKKYSLDKYFDEMYFNFDNDQPHFFKNKVIKKLKIDLYVDDDLPLLIFLAKRNPKTLFFWFNKKISSKINNNLFAIKSLSEMIKHK